MSAARRAHGVFRALVPVFWLALAGAGHAAEPRLSLVTTWVSGQPGGTESLSYQPKSRMLAVTDGEAGKIYLVSLSRLDFPVDAGELALDLPDRHVINAVAFHPNQDALAVAVAGPVGSAGEILLLDLRGKALARYPAGHGPDDVRFSPSGKWLVATNEAEEYWREEGAWRSYPGSVTLVDLAEGLLNGIAREVRLDALSRRRGLTALEDGRFLEREVDGGEVEIPLDSRDPTSLEPECAAFAPDETTVYVSLQENNGVAVIDVARAVARDTIALGTTEHLADLKDDGRVSFTDSLRAFREPDQIAVTPDGRYLVTADEGDTDPKASRTWKGPAGGGRTLSVVDLTTGEVIGDTGGQLDEMAHAAGVYPDGRSDNRGSEPEGVVAFESGGGSWAVVALERADALALVDLGEPRDPRVRKVISLRREGEGRLGPEGIVSFEWDGARYVATANEKSGTVSVARVEF